MERRAARHTIRLTGLALMVTLAASACGFQQRREQAEYVIDTPDRARQAGTASFAMRSGLESIEVSDQDLPLYPFPAPMAGTLDMNTRRATPAILAPEQRQGGDAQPQPAVPVPQGVQPVPGPGAIGVSLGTETQAATRGQLTTIPFMLFDDHVLLAHKFNAEEGDREWVKVDLAEIDEDDFDEPIIGFNFINPVIWIELIGGALTGSVERVGVEEVAGERLTHYKANLDREKAFEDLGEDAYEHLNVLFQLMGASSIVMPADIWLDDEGLPRKLEYAVEQRIDRHNAFELQLAIELGEFRQQADIALPTEDEIVQVDGVLQLIAESGAEQIMQSYQSRLARQSAGGGGAQGVPGGPAVPGTAPNGG